MSIVEDIIRGEIEFPRDFTNVTERPYGVLYHNRQIPDSHDSNHARILFAEGELLTRAVADVSAFYRRMKVTPRVYHLSEFGQGPALRDALGRAGFEIRDQKDTFFVHSEPSRLADLPGVEVRRVTSVCPELAAMIERSEGLRARKMVQRRAALPNYHLHVAFVGGQPVSMASLHDLGYVCRVDDVLTDVQHRGKGYARAVIHHLVRYHAEALGNPLNLYSENPTAIRIYQEAGFVKLDARLECWSAWQESP